MFQGQLSSFQILSRTFWMGFLAFMVKKIFTRKLLRCTLFLIDFSYLANLGTQKVHWKTQKPQGLFSWSLSKYLFHICPTLKSETWRFLKQLKFLSTNSDFLSQL